MCSHGPVNEQEKVSTDISGLIQIKKPKTTVIGLTEQLKETSVSSDLTDYISDKRKRYMEKPCDTE